VQKARDEKRDPGEAGQKAGDVERDPEVAKQEVPELMSLT
jgi:hypothetical protein